MSKGNFIQRWWWARRRRIDMEDIWPKCKAQAMNDHGTAHHLFMQYAESDPAWAEWYGHDLWQAVQKLR